MHMKLRFRNYFWGLFFIFFAAFIIVSQIDRENVFAKIGFWSILATVFFVAIFIKSITSLNFFGIFVPLAFLYSIYQEPLSLPEISFWTLLLAAVLLSIGLQMLFRRRKRIIKFSKKHDKIVSHEGETLSGNRLYAKATFCESSKYLHSDNLIEGEFIVKCGEMNLYFDQVQLSPDGAEVFLDCTLGTMNLYLPKHWQVKDKLHAVIGNISNNPSSQNVNGPELTLKGEVRAGNIDIHYI